MRIMRRWMRCRSPTGNLPPVQLMRAERLMPPIQGFGWGRLHCLRTGRSFGGNQESRCFASGMCAERSLLYYLQANFSGVRIVALATASVPGERECYPMRRLSAGACRYRKTTGFPDPRGDVLRTQCYGSTGSAAVVTLYF
ncbi:MAG: hypothetical protein ACLR8Y_18240 [Alistipes indistinctus]